LRAEASARYQTAYHRGLSGRIWGALEGTPFDARHNSGEPSGLSFSNPFPFGEIEEGDELWAEIPEKHAKVLEQELLEELTGDERETLSMYLEKRRKVDPFWGK